MTNPCADDFLRAQDAVPDPDADNPARVPAPRTERLVDLLRRGHVDDDPPTVPR